MKVAFLKDPCFATHSIQWMLEENFGQENVSPLSIMSLDKEDLGQYDILVLPGVTGEVSPYPYLLTRHRISNIVNAVKDGLVLWTDCAATYEVMKNIEFLSSSREEKTRVGLGIFDAVARGPVQGHALTPSTADRFKEVVIKRIYYKDGGMSFEADVCYGNGPGIHLSDKELQNPNTKVIARYGEDEDSPIAAVSKKLGLGMILSLGVLVQISPSHIQGSAPDAQSAIHRKTIRRQLASTDNNRQHFLGVLLQQISDHCAELKANRKTGNILQRLLQERHVEIT